MSAPSQVDLANQKYHNRCFVYCLSKRITSHLFPTNVLFLLYFYQGQPAILQDDQAHTTHYHSVSVIHHEDSKADTSKKSHYSLTHENPLTGNHTRPPKDLVKIPLIFWLMYFSLNQAMLQKQLRTSGVAGRTDCSQNAVHIHNSRRHLPNSICFYQNPNIH